MCPRRPLPPFPDWPTDRLKKLAEAVLARLVAAPAPIETEAPITEWLAENGGAEGIDFLQAFQAYRRQPDALFQNPEALLLFVAFQQVRSHNPYTDTELDRLALLFTRRGRKLMSGSLLGALYVDLERKADGRVLERLVCRVQEGDDAPWWEGALKAVLPALKVEELMAMVEKLPDSHQHIPAQAIMERDGKHPHAYRRIAKICSNYKVRQRLAKNSTAMRDPEVRQALMASRGKAVLASLVEYCEPPHLDKVVRQCLKRDIPTTIEHLRKRNGSLRGIDPETLSPALKHPDQQVRARTLRLLGQLGKG